MRENRNHYRAAVTLGAAVLGFLVSYPFHGSFWGGLLYSGFSASMIGGLADWFAVTALFRKPLGISGKFFRTEIIPKKREYIFHTLVDMVGNELLTAENIKNKLSEVDIPAVILRYMHENNGKQDMTAILQDIILDAVNKMDPDDVGELVDDLVKDKASHIEISPLIAGILEKSVSYGYDQRVIVFVVDEIVRLAKQKEMNDLIRNLIIKAKNSYETDYILRELLDRILFSASKINDAADEIQHRLVLMLEELKEPDHRIRILLHSKIVQWIKDLRENEALRTKIETWKVKQIQAHLHVKGPIANLVKSYQESLQMNNQGKTPETCIHAAYREVAASSEPRLKWLNWVRKQMDDVLAHFQENKEQRKKVDKTIKTAVSRWIDEKHVWISKLVKERLDLFTNDMLIEFIEAKAGNDLQLIRINGSIVGGLAGVIIYLLTFWV